MAKNVATIHSATCGFKKRNQVRFVSHALLYCPDSKWPVAELFVSECKRPFALLPWRGQWFCLRSRAKARSAGLAPALRHFKRSKRLYERQAGKARPKGRAAELKEFPTWLLYCPDSKFVGRFGVFSSKCKDTSHFCPTLNGPDSTHSADIWSAAVLPLLLPSLACSGASAAMNGRQAGLKKRRQAAHSVNDSTRSSNCLEPGSFGSWASVLS
jgi:hypothetical protein